MTPKRSKPESEIVLLAVTGMSPAVLTETVWALAHETPPIIPDRVFVLTTISGRQAIERELLLPVPDREGWTRWQVLREDILSRLDPACSPAADDRLILEPPRVITAPNPRTGQSDWLEDLRTPAQNEAAANFILEEVRRIVENRDTRLIASLAGGRKTMGALLYAALTLLGRETDRLTHVLVNDPFEDARLRPRFYFPSGKPIAHHLPAGDGAESREFSSDEARIELADVPFVRLRNRFSEMAELPGSFHELVRRYSRQLDADARRKARVEIRHSDRLLLVDGQAVRMRPKALAILHALLDQQANEAVQRGQLEAQDVVTAWIAQHSELVWRGKVTNDDLKHELSHLRATLKKHHVTWLPPLRSLRFAPFQLLYPKAPMDVSPDERKPSGRVHPEKRS
jgi:CRISPR-associated protein (TIGR02584 family)